MGRIPVFTPTNWTPRLTRLENIRAVIFDVHGTLLLGGGPVRSDRHADDALGNLLRQRGLPSPSSVTQLLAEAVERHHHSKDAEFPEVDLRALCSEVIGTEMSHELFLELEALRQPLIPMPGIRETLRALHPLPLGLISNAQADTIPVLEGILGGPLFAPDLTILSYQHGIAKPAPELYCLLASALERRSIAPCSTLLVGNDPRHDILPAKHCGFRTALIAADHSSLRAGSPDEADAVITDLRQLPGIIGL